MYNYLLNWFAGYWAFMFNYEFSLPSSDEDELIVEEEMLRQILNVDKATISLNGSKARVGSRLVVTFYDPYLPMPCVSAAKSSLSCTGTFRSSAARECVPPHWQLLTTATAVEREKVRFNFLHHIVNTWGRFGCEEVREWPATIGMNKKGEMNNNEFEKYIYN
jgi:hypothetical protein